MPSYTLPFASPQRIAGPGNQTLSDITFSDYFPQNQIFTNGGLTRYCFLVNGAGRNADSWPQTGGAPTTKLYIHVYKSTDGGATWAEVGTPHTKELPPENGQFPEILSGPNVTFGFISCACCLDPADSTKVLVLRNTWDFTTYVTGADHILVISQFDMGADDWAADITARGDANAPVTDNGNQSQDLQPWFVAPFQIVKRASDNHIFALYQKTEFLNQFSLSGNDLTVQASAANPGGTADLSIIATQTVRAGSYSFVAGDIGKSLWIKSSAAVPVGMNPGAYVIAGLSGTDAVVIGAVGMVGTFGGTWEVIGNNQVSSASHTFVSNDVGFALTITAGAGWNPGVYGIIAVSGGKALLSGIAGTGGAVNGNWSTGLDGTNGYFARVYLSEFDGANWLAPQLALGTLGQIHTFMPLGMALGSSDRIHLFAEECYRDLNPSYTTANQPIIINNIWHRTLTSGSVLETATFVPETPASNFQSGLSGFCYVPFDRLLLDNSTEISLPFLYTSYFGGSTTKFPWQSSYACQLNRVFFGSADNPTLAVDPIATGTGTAIHQALRASNFVTDQTAPNWSLASNLTNRDLFLVTISPSDLSPNNANINLFSYDNVGLTWDNGMTDLFTDAASQSLGALNSSSWPGFIGMALTYLTPFGDYQFDDPWYFELDVTTQVWSITVGSLPPGLSINPNNGNVSGTPTTPGTFTFTVHVTNSSSASCASPPDGAISTPYSHTFPAVFSDGDTADVECSITIGDVALVIICNDPPIGIIGTFYTHDFPASGGTPPYVFSITGGMLPPGLTLDENTGNVSGTPTQKGTFSFTVTVVDDNGVRASVVCSITIRKRCLLVQVQA